MHLLMHVPNKIVPILFGAMTDKSKWQTHVAALECLGFLCVTAAEQVEGLPRTSCHVSLDVMYKLVRSDFELRVSV